MFGHELIYFCLVLYNRTVMLQLEKSLKSSLEKVFLSDFLTYFHIWKS